MSRSEAPAVPSGPRSSDVRARARCTRCGRFLPAGEEGLCKRCRAATEQVTASPGSPVGAPPGTAPDEAPPPDAERTLIDDGPGASQAPPFSASREEVIRRTRTDFVVARPSELHPDLQNPERPTAATPHPSATLRTEGRSARRLRRVLSWGDGVLVIVIVAVLFAALMAYWLSPTP